MLRTALTLQSKSLEKTGKPVKVPSAHYRVLVRVKHLNLKWLLGKVEGQEPGSGEILAP